MNTTINIEHTLSLPERAALLSLASAASRLEWPDAPAAPLLEVLENSLKKLPQQLAQISNDASFSLWLSVAALAEQRGQFDIARNIVDGVRHSIEEAKPQNVEPLQALELRAICWTRRGRLSRTLGNHDDAFECYTQARHLVRRRPWLDASPFAVLGLAALAAERGNFPAAARYASTLLRHAPALAAVHRLGAHHMLAFVSRKRGRLLDAVLHSWEALDLVPAGTNHAHDLLASISEIALELGEFDAAIAGFDSVLQLAQSSHVRVAAAAGAATACTKRAPALDTNSVALRLHNYAGTLAALLHSDIAPRDACIAHIALARINRVLMDTASSDVYLERASEIAHRFGLFELQFTIEESLAQFATTGGDALKFADAVRLSNAHPKRTTRHPGIARLLELSVI